MKLKNRERNQTNFQRKSQLTCVNNHSTTVVIREEAGHVGDWNQAVNACAKLCIAQESP